MNTANPRDKNLGFFTPFYKIRIYYSRNGGDPMSLLTISAKDISKYIGRTGTVLIDLRTKSEYSSGHIPTAVNLPFTEVEEMVMPYSKTYKLILYCTRGNSSLRYGRYLSEQGYDVVSVCGGFRAYKGKISVD